MQDIKIEKIDYNTPITLREALTQRRQIEEGRVLIGDENIYDVFLRNVEKNDELASMPIKKFVAKGSSAVVFETLDGNILKLTEGSHFPLRRPVEDFDVPIYKSGKIGKIRYYIEEKLYQHGLSDGFVAEIIDMIKAKGYKPKDLSEMDINQIGISKEGNLYLLDPECAKYKTLFHALWAKTKKVFKRV